MSTKYFLHTPAFLALFLVPTLLCTSQWLYEKNHIFEPKNHEFLQIEYTPHFFKFITAGYWPAAVEGMWISLLQQISQNQISPEAKGEVVRFYDLATDLDPYFYELYEQAGVYFSFFLEDATRATQFLKKGISTYETRVLSEREKLPPQFQSRFWTHPYSLYIFLAYAQAFQLQDWASAKKTFLAAAEVKGAPDYIKQMKVWLQEEGSEKVLAQKILKSLIQTTTDPVVKAKYQERLKSL